jgi:hypothetical protein
MKNFIITAGLGWGIKRVAPVIASKIGYLFEHYVRVFAEKIRGIDNWLEEKSGVDLFSDEFQGKYDSIVNHVVEFTEAAFTDQAKIRFLLNRILRNEAPIKPEDLKNYAGKTWKEFLDSLPAELKGIISLEKEEFAARVIKEMMDHLTGTPVSDSVVKSSIRAVVKAKNANQEHADAVFKEESLSGLWSRLIEESKERQDALKNG